MSSTGGRDVSFVIVIGGHGHADRITQKTIERYLGTGYSVVNADSIDGNEDGRDTLKLVTLRIPVHVPAADVAGKLKAIPGATNVIVPDNLYSTLNEARLEIKESEKRNAEYKAERKKLEEQMAKDEEEADRHRAKMLRDLDRADPEEKE